MLFGDRGKAVKAFVDAMSFHPDLDSDEDLLCDAVFVFILCGEDRLGKNMGQSCGIGCTGSSFPQGMPTMSGRRAISIWNFWQLTMKSP